MQSTGIDLLVPGLLGPIADLDDLYAIPQFPSIERALSRAGISETTHQEYSATLFQLFGLDQSDDLSTAPYCRLADGGQVDDSYWLQLTPVHLQPDGDGLLLFDTAHLNLSLDEAQQLLSLVRDHFSDRNWQLELADPQRWYLGLKTKPDLQTSPLTDVIGRNINSFLPKGGEAKEWNVLLNELQMLLHSSKVNMLREGRGELPINGVWLHGGGSYQHIGQTNYVGLYGDDPLLRGLAQATGIESRILPEDGVELTADKERHLMVYDRLQRPLLDANLNGWIEAVGVFNRWLEQLLIAVRSNSACYLDIYPCNGRVFRVDSRSLRRFWRRNKVIAHYVSSQSFLSTPTR